MKQALFTHIIEYNYLLEESFLSSYNREDEALKMGYDAVLEIGKSKIFILHEVIKIKENSEESEEIAKSEIYKYSRQAVNILMQRHIKLQKNFEVTTSKEQPMYFIGMASLMAMHDGETFNIDHQFGSNYFQEQLVLDFDIIINTN